jgi:hypothetical protein
MKRIVAIVLLAACGHQVKVDPVKVEPIHITVDVNLHDSDKDTTPVGEVTAK